MVKLKVNKSFEEYKEMIQKLTPVLTDNYVEGVQDYIENQVVEYSKENIQNEEFLQFVADKWAHEVTVEETKEHPEYNFSLNHGEAPLINVCLSLGINEEETEVMVKDIEVKVNP